MLAGTDDHPTGPSPIILNLESMGLTHLESEILVVKKPEKPEKRKALNPGLAVRPKDSV